MDDVQQTIHYTLPGRGEVAVQLRGAAAVLTNRLAFTKGDEAAGGSGAVLAPMHGNVLAIDVAVGDRVEAGQDVAVMEAMKMEHRLSAQVSGEVIAVNAAVGDQLATGTVVLEIAADE
jgi:geranyl-CoA carboxylase alpha subunit